MSKPKIPTHISNASDSDGNPIGDALGQVSIVTQRRVSCDGGGGALGHPKVYMDMGTGTEVECKYCDRIFRFKP